DLNLAWPESPEQVRHLTAEEKRKRKERIPADTFEDLDQAVRDGKIDLGIRLRCSKNPIRINYIKRARYDEGVLFFQRLPYPRPTPWACVEWLGKVHIVYLEPHGRRVDRDPLAFPDSYELGLEIELISPAEGVEARRARDYVQDKIERANQHIFLSHLQEAGAEQRGIPWVVIKTTAKVDSGKGWLSLAALVPLILILMTITGAVYPAIDLTAGERERGTLEILVAAPIPRLGLLFAKYVTV